MIVTCKSCSKKYQIADEKAGIKFRCKGCQAVIDTNECAETAQSAPAAAAPASGTIIVTCQECSKQYRLPGEKAGAKFRCKGCQGVIDTNQPGVVQTEEATQPQTQQEAPAEQKTEAPQAEATTAQQATEEKPKAVASAMLRLARRRTAIIQSTDKPESPAAPTEEGEEAATPQATLEAETEVAEDTTAATEEAVTVEAEVAPEPEEEQAEAEAEESFELEDEENEDDVGLAQDGGADDSFDLDTEEEEESAAQIQLSGDENEDDEFALDLDTTEDLAAATAESDAEIELEVEVEAEEPSAQDDLATTAEDEPVLAMEEEEDSLLATEEDEESEISLEDAIPEKTFDFAGNEKDEGVVLPAEEGNASITDEEDIFYGTKDEAAESGLHIIPEDTEEGFSLTDLEAKLESEEEAKKHDYRYNNLPQINKEESAFGLRVELEREDTSFGKAPVIEDEDYDANAPLIAEDDEDRDESFYVASGDEPAEDNNDEFNFSDAQTAVTPLPPEDLLGDLEGSADLPSASLDDDEIFGESVPFDESEEMLPDDSDIALSLMDEESSREIILAAEQDAAEETSATEAQYVVEEAHPATAKAPDFATDEIDVSMELAESAQGEDITAGSEEEELPTAELADPELADEAEEAVIIEEPLPDYVLLADECSEMDEVEVSLEYDAEEITLEQAKAIFEPQEDLSFPETENTFGAYCTACHAHYNLPESFMAREDITCAICGSTVNVLAEGEDFPPVPQIEAEAEPEAKYEDALEDESEAEEDANDEIFDDTDDVDNTEEESDNDEYGFDEYDGEEDKHDSSPLIENASASLHDASSHTSHSSGGSYDFSDYEESVADNEDEPAILTEADDEDIDDSLLDETDDIDMPDDFEDIDQKK